MRLFNRQKLLLRAISKLSKKGVYSRIALVKAMFLLKYESAIEEQINGFYSFYPYQYGPFSQKLFSDLRQLHEAGLITQDETSLTDYGNTYLESHNINFENELNPVLDRFNGKDDFLKYVYNKYPRFAVNSKLAKNSKPRLSTTGFFTIGYEKKDIDEFLNILIENEIKILIDVRKNPFSMNFSYVKSKLKEYLEKVGIEYLHFPELGVESEDRKNLHSREDYLQLFMKYKTALPSREATLHKIIELGQKNRIALLCFEKEHTFCHRGIIGKYLEAKSFKVINL